MVYLKKQNVWGREGSTRPSLSTRLLVELLQVSFTDSRRARTANSGFSINPVPTWTYRLICRSLPLLQQSHNVVIQPVSLQFLLGHVLGAGNPSSADLVPSAAVAVEGLIHLPFRARVEEREGVTFLQRPVVHDTHFHLAHVENERRVAGMVAEDQVRVQLDVRVGSCLHRCIRFLCWRGRRDLGEEGACGQVD